MQPQSKIRVLSVDDHEFLTEGLRARLALEPDLELVGSLQSAEGLSSKVRDLGAQVVLLDIELPKGPDPFEAAAELRKQLPGVRTVMLSAFVRDRYVDAAVKAGAWGYLSKSDPVDSILSAIRAVACGTFTFGPTVLERCRQIGQPDPSQTSPPGTASDSGTGVPVAAGASGGLAPIAEPPASRLGLLTPRELQILRMIGKGLSRTEIAKVIFRSPKTVDAHRSAIMEKLAIHDRVELARYAIREGLVEI